MVDGMVDRHLANFNVSGAQLLIGSGRFIGAKTIEVTVADGDARSSGRKSYYQYGLSHEG